jgi:hypothetical protein
MVSINRQPEGDQRGSSVEGERSSDGEVSGPDDRV